MKEKFKKLEKKVNKIFKIHTKYIENILSKMPKKEGRYEKIIKVIYILT